MVCLRRVCLHCPRQFAAASGRGTAPRCRLLAGRAAARQPQHARAHTGIINPLNRIHQRRHVTHARCGFQVLERIKALGYSGIECPVATVMRFGCGRFRALLQEQGLLWVAQVFSSGPPPIPGNEGLTSEHADVVHEADPAATHDVKAHTRIWAAQVLEAKRLGDVLQSITSHTGRDYFTPAEADEMFDFCTAFEAEHGVTVNHETHRGRILYTCVSAWWPTLHCAPNPLRLPPAVSPHCLHACTVRGHTQHA
jgi:hypothetical protein